ncbi:MAG: hypothetical protein RL333_933 [Pseudomonadota bacterium]
MNEVMLDYVYRSVRFALTKLVPQALEAVLLLGVEGGASRVQSMASKMTKCQNATREEEQQGPPPEEQGNPFDRWVVKDKITVAIGEEADGLFLALPGLYSAIDLVTKIPSQIGVRVPQRLILANEAPEFLDQGFISRLLFGVRKVADFDRMAERHREAGQKADKDQVS